MRYGVTDCILILGSGSDLKDRMRREEQDARLDPAGTSYQLNASFDSALSSHVHRSDLSADQISGKPILIPILILILIPILVVIHQLSSPPFF